MVLDVRVLNSSDSVSLNDEDEPPFWPGTPTLPQKGLGRFHIRPILQLVLQDAQTRLLFKAQAIVQSDIRFYTPKDNDLAYPDRLISEQVIFIVVSIVQRDSIDAENHRPNSLGLPEREEESQRRLFPLPSIQEQITWYPTLRKTLWVLSQLYDFVNVSIRMHLRSGWILTPALHSLLYLTTSRKKPLGCADSH